MTNLLVINCKSRGCNQHDLTTENSRDFEASTLSRDSPLSFAPSTSARTPRVSISLIFLTTSILIQLCIFEYQLYFRLYINLIDDSSSEDDYRQPLQPA